MPSDPTPDADTTQLAYRSPDADDENVRPFLTFQRVAALLAGGVFLVLGAAFLFIFFHDRGPVLWLEFILGTARGAAGLVLIAMGIVYRIRDAS